MALFRYKAERDGEIYEGEAEVQDKFALFGHVRAEGGALLSYEAVDEKNFFSFDKLNALFSTVKEQDKIVLARNLSAMVDAGLSLSRALAVLIRQTKNPKLRKVLLSIEGEVKRGLPLHQALAKFPSVFPSLFIAMVRAGEESGRLGESLRVIANQMDKAYTLKKKIKGALIYPSIIVVAMIGIGILMLIYVVPTLTQTFEELGTELPASTQLVITTSEFMTEHTTVALSLFLLLVLSVVFGLRTRGGKRAFDWLILHIPLIRSIAKKANAARTTRTLSSLLSAGVDVVQALTITSEVLQNSYYKEVMERARDAVENGQTISSVLAKHEHLYFPLVSEMTAVGEETGAISDLLKQVADFYEAEVEQQTKDMSTVIEPFLMVFIGAVVGFFALSMIAPIYSLSEGI